MRVVSEPQDDEVSTGQWLTWRQAHEAAYRFVARYYDYQRTRPVLEFLEAISWTGDDPASNGPAWAAWEACVQQTLDRAALPVLPSPWDD
jgi:hypothetical protein